MASDPRPGTWIILPTYDEAENLPGIAAAILAELPSATLLVVDDGSPDGTGGLADQLASRTSGSGSAIARRSRASAGPTSTASGLPSTAALTSSSRWMRTGRTTRPPCLR